MPLDVARLRDSDLITEASAEGFRAAVVLWCASWHQQPAASLPNKPAVLANLAGFGRDVAGWNAIADEALHNYIECSDGRLYHQLIAEKAIDAWERKVEFDENKEKERLRKADWRRRKAEQEARDGTDVSRGTGRGHDTGRDGGMTRDGTGQSRLRQGQGTLDSDNDRDTERERAPARALATSNGHVPDGLIRTINEAFVSKGKHLMLSGHQMEFVHALAERASHESDPADWTRRYLNTAWRLREGGKDVWRGQAWQPSAVCGEKMQARVIEAMDQQEFKPSPELLATMERFSRRRSA